MKQKRFILGGIVACLLSSCSGGGSSSGSGTSITSAPPSPLLTSGTVNLSLKRTAGGDWNDLLSWNAPVEFKQIPTLTNWTTSNSTLYAALDGAGTASIPLVIKDNEKVGSAYPYRFSVLDMNKSYLKIEAETSSPVTIMKKVGSAYPYRFSVLDMNKSYLKIEAETSSPVTILKGTSTIAASQTYSSKYFYLEKGSTFQGKFSFSNDGDLSQVQPTDKDKFTSSIIPNRDNYGITFIDGSFEGNLNIDQLNIVFGTGTIKGNVTNSKGIIFADKDHILNITGNYTQNGGELYLKPKDTITPLLKVTGTADLSSGSITVDLLGITEATSSAYILLQAKTVSLSSLKKTFPNKKSTLYPNIKTSGNHLVLEFLASAPDDGITTIGTTVSKLWKAPDIVHSFASSKGVYLFKSQNLNAQSFESEWGAAFTNHGKTLTESLTFSRASFLNSDYALSKVNKLAISETLTLFQNQHFKVAPEYRFTIADTTEIYPYLHEWNVHSHFSFSKNFDLRTSLGFKRSDDWTETSCSASFKNSFLPFIDSLKFQSSFMKYKELSAFRHFLELEFKS